MNVSWRPNGKTYRLLSLAVISAAVMIQFQNCGKKPGSAASVNVSSRSPFYSQRVYLEKQNSSDLAKSEESETSSPELETAERDGTGVTVVLHNGCAVEQCDLDKSSSIACEILRNSKTFDQLANNVQAYDWQLPTPDMKSEELEELIASNSIDNQCIIGVSLNHSYKMEGTLYPSNDPGIASQYYHKTINGAEAYDFFWGQNLSQVIVGVIDTGIQPAHEDIYYGGMNVNLSQSCTTVCHWHGNFVSSIINGKKGNSKGGHGIAPNAYIYSFQIGDNTGRLTTTELVNAVQMATAYNVEILNLSLGGSRLLDFAFQDAIIKAIDRGIIVVASAGNDSYDIGKIPTYPAAFNYDGQITVGAASPSGIDDKTMSPPYSTTAINSPLKRDFFSNYSSGLVHVAAPGTGIYSATLDNSYGIARGTSFSAPMVTGSLALIKGYLKGKGIEISPEMLRTLFLEGSRRVDTLSETIDGQQKDVFQNNLFLDLKKLKETVVQFTDRVSQAPARIELVSSSVSTVGGVKSVNIRVDVRDGDISKGLVLKAYTNKAFLNDSMVSGYECKILTARQVCDISISFTKLLIDPGVYLAVYDSTGKMISDLSIVKTTLNLGDKKDGVLKGEIVAAVHQQKSFLVEGWACLAGFADAIEIQVRVGSNTGAPIATFVTNRQGRGEYFAACNSPEINFGFRYAIPENYMNARTPYNFYFKAVHVETGKTRDLPVYTYQPTYQDSKAAVYWDHVYMDPNLGDQTMQLTFTKKEFKNFILTLEGSACYRSSRKPAAFTVGLEAQNYHRLIPAMRKISKYISSGEATASMIQAEGTGFEIKTLSRSISSENANRRPLDNGGMIGHLLDFSETLDEMTYIPHLNAQAMDIKGVLTYEGDRGKIESGLITVTPDIERNDGCLVPSGFNVSIDVRPYITNMGTSVHVSYRADHYTEAQIKALPDFADFKDLFKLSEGENKIDFSTLFFDPKALNVFTQPLFSPGEIKNLFTDFNSFKQGHLFWFESDLKNKGWQKGWQKLTCVYASNPSNISGSTYRDWSYKAGINFNTGLSGPGASGCQNNANIWIEPLALNIMKSSSMTLVPVYTSEVVTLMSSNVGQFFPVISISKASAYGELDTDFRLQVKYNGTGPWYDVALEDIRTYGEAGAKNTLLSSDASIPVGTTSLQLRVLANGQNQFTLTSVGMFTE